MLNRAPATPQRSPAFTDKAGRLSDYGVQVLTEMWRQVAAGFPVVPCKVTGTNNVLTLTPTLNAEGGTTYGDGMTWFAQPTKFSTASVTARIGALPAKKVFTFAGAVQAGSGDIVANSFYLFVYSATLDGGNGGLILIGGPINDASSVVGSATKYFNPTFFGNAGTGIVHKFNRIQAGVAALGSADVNQSVTTWENAYFPNSSTYSQISSISAIGELAISGFVRTADYRTWSGGASGGAQGINGFAVNDDLGAGNPIAVGAYANAIAIAGQTAGITEGAEINISSGQAPATITPSGGVIGGSTICLNLSVGQNAAYNKNISAALVVGANLNSVKYTKGIVGIAGGFDASVGAGGAGVMLEMPRNVSVRWLNSGSTTDAEIWGNADGLVTPKAINYLPQTAPANPASGWVIYVDSGDSNKLKALASTGNMVDLTGVWTAYTPTITAGTGAFTTVSATGKWVRFGKIVTFRITISITTNGTAATSVKATLPVSTTASAVFAGKETALTGKMLDGAMITGALAITFYDGTYPGADGALLLVSGSYEVL